MKRANKAAHEQAVLELAKHGGITLAAGGGRTFDVELVELGLEVEITMAVRRTVSREQETEHRDRALELLTDEGHRDRCECSAKNRSTWRLSRTKECSKPVTSVVVTRGAYLKGAYDATAFSYSFRCTHHREEGASPENRIAVVTLPAPALKVLRAQRKREQVERERFDKLTEAEKVANDAQLVGRKDEAAEILQQQRPEPAPTSTPVSRPIDIMLGNTPGRPPLPMVQVRMTGPMPRRQPGQPVLMTAGMATPRRPR